MTEFIKISYTGKVEDGRVFDTTSEEIAKKEGMFDPNNRYAPLSVIVGEGQVIAGLDEALKGMKVGEEKKVEIPPEKGYGKKNPELVRLVPIKKFKEQKINPIPGMPIEIDGRIARVQTVSGGRVRVDFNHELAGRNLVFEVKVEGKAKTDKEKAEFLVEKNFSTKEDFDIKKKEKTLKVDIPENAYKDRNLLIRKAGLAAEAFKYLDVDELTYTEVWKAPQKKKK